MTQCWLGLGLDPRERLCYFLSVRCTRDRTKKYYFSIAFWIFNPTPCCGFGIVSIIDFRISQSDSFIRTSGFKRRTLDKNLIFPQISETWVGRGIWPKNSTFFRFLHFLPVLTSMIQVSKSNKNKNFYDRFLKLLFIILLIGTNNYLTWIIFKNNSLETLWNHNYLQSNQLF